MVPDREAGTSERQATARAALAAALAAAGGGATPGAGGAAQNRPTAGGNSPVAEGAPAKRDSAARDRALAEAGGAESGAEQAGDPRDPVQRARELCLRLLAGRPRTRTELADTMRRRGVPDEAAAAVLARFTDAGLIDDAAFARAWVESRHYSRGLSRRSLSAELRRQGIDNEEIREAVGTLDPEQEVATARRLVEQKMAGTRGQPSEARVRRTAGVLARKGYPPGLVFRLIKEYLEQEGAQDAVTLELVADQYLDPDADPNEAGE